MLRRSAAIVVLGLAVCAACSSSSKSSSPPPSSAAASATTVPASIPTKEKAQSAMLTAADIKGFSLTDAQYTPNDPGQPFACGQSDPDKDHPPTLKVGSQLDNESPRAAIVETLEYYPDTAAALNEFNAGKQGFTCSDGSIVESTGTTIPVKLQSPTDVTSQVGGDQAFQVQLSSSQFKGVLTASTKGNAVVIFQYEAAADADEAKLPNPTDVAKVGVEKIASTLGG